MYVKRHEQLKIGHGSILNQIYYIIITIQENFIVPNRGINFATFVIIKYKIESREIKIKISSLLKQYVNINHNKIQDKSIIKNLN